MRCEEDIVMKTRIFAAILAVLILLSLVGAVSAEDESTETAEQTETDLPSESSEPVESPEPTEKPIDQPTDIGSVEVTPPEYRYCSAWAEAELLDAQQQGMFPAVFAGADMTQPITRVEFAAIAVKLYEKMSGRTAQASGSGTFSDTSDVDVLKCHALGIVNGMEDGDFHPNEKICRQDAATMLVRAYKAAYWQGWTLANDASYTANTLDYGDVELYADHGWIKQYAYTAVYFLTKRGAVKGLGDGKFGPDGYCTREQAVVMALRFMYSGK